MSLRRKFRNIPFLAISLRVHTACMQIEVVLATRDALLKQREELETKAKQQSQDQSDIYQYLRKKLKDNYVAIAELETKVGRRASTNTRDSSNSRGRMIDRCLERFIPLCLITFDQIMGAESSWYSM